MNTLFVFPRSPDGTGSPVTIVNQKIKVQMATFRYESDLKGHDRRRFENVTGKAQKKIESKNCITRHIERLRRKNPLESICY